MRPLFPEKVREVRWWLFATRLFVQRFVSIPRCIIRARYFCNSWFLTPAAAAYCMQPIHFFRRRSVLDTWAPQPSHQRPCMHRHHPRNSISNRRSKGHRFSGKVRFLGWIYYCRSALFDMVLYIICFAGELVSTPSVKGKSDLQPDCPAAC